MNKNSTVQPLSENTRKVIIITAIVVVAVIILSVALALILKPTSLSPDDQDTTGNGSSSLTIKNGDFEYYTDSNAAFPRDAQNWSKYGYKKPSGSSHDFESITTTDKAVMGIVNVSEDADDDETWTKNVKPDLDAEGLSDVTNPGLHKTIDDGDDANKNVYMIATKEPTTASILSDSLSIPSGASVKISIWLNTQQLADGTNAVVMIQKSTVSALSKNWYAYNFSINKNSTEYPADENGWQELVFYIFNRDASSKTIRINIGIGNVYSGEEEGGADTAIEDADTPIQGEGVLFVDDITYEVKTANDYREVVDNDAIPHSYKVIENEDITVESKYFGLETVYGADSQNLRDFTDAEDFASAAGGYSPFTNRDDFFKDDENGDHNVATGFKVYKYTHGGETVDKALALRLKAEGSVVGAHNGINVKSSLLLKDHHHISFWVRVDKLNELAFANVYVQRWSEDDNDWTDLDTAKWTVIKAVEDIKEDKNCGWVKYDVYLKPSVKTEEISVLFVLGKKANYTDEEKTLGLIPNGSMYITSPAYETISSSDYTSASSGNNVKKLDLVDLVGSYSTTITNGSFSTLDSSGRQPANWTPAFGGDNSIFRDGLGNLGVFEPEQRLASTIANSGTVQNFTSPVKLKGSGLILDDPQCNVLRISNQPATSFGYYSANITLSRHTAYVFSVMFRADSDNTNAVPFIYLLNTDTTLDRTDRIVTSVTTTEQSTKSIDAELLDFDYNNDEIDGWTRYFMIVVTGDESMTVRLALFNGSIDGDTKQAGTIYYDKAEMKTLGTYSLEKDEDAEEGSEEAKYYKVEWSEYRHFEGNEEYGENFGELLEKDVLTEWGIEVKQPTEEEWEAMRLIPEDEDDTDDDHDHDTETEAKDVDLGLLFSVISSVALVAALLVVFVVKAYKNKGKNVKAA